VGYILGLLMQAQAVNVFFWKRMHRETHSDPPAAINPEKP